MAALSDSFLKSDATDPQEERAIVRLLRFLEMRIQRRDLLQEDLSEKQNHFRNKLVKLEHENMSLRYDNNEQKKIISMLEGRICKLQNHIDGLLCKLNNGCDAMRNIQQELRDRDRQLQQHTLEKHKIIQRCNIMVQAETDRMTEEMQMKLREQHERLMSCIKKKDDKLRLMRQILNSTCEDNVTLTPPITSSPCGHIHQTLFSHARTISSDPHEKATRPNQSLSKEKPTMAFMDSQIFSSHNQIRQISSHTRINSDDVKAKAAKKSILMTVTESFMPSDSKTKIVEKLNSTSDSSSSSTIASVDTTIVSKINFNTKVTKRVA